MTDLEKKFINIYWDDKKNDFRLKLIPPDQATLNQLITANLESDGKLGTGHDALLEIYDRCYVKCPKTEAGKRFIASLDQQYLWCRSFFYSYLLVDTSQPPPDVPQDYRIHEFELDKDSTRGHCQICLLPKVFYYQLSKIIFQKIKFPFPSGARSQILVLMNYDFDKPFEVTENSVELFNAFIAEIKGFAPNAGCFELAETAQKLLGFHRRESVLFVSELGAAEILNVDKSDEYYDELDAKDPVKLSNYSYAAGWKARDGINQSVFNEYFNFNK